MRPCSNGFADLAARRTWRSSGPNSAASSHDARQSRAGRAIKRHYGGELRGLAHEQLNRQRGFLGTTLGPANKGRRLSDAERQAIEQRMRDDGRLRLALLEADWQRGNHAKIGSMASDAELSGDAEHRAIP